MSKTKIVHFPPATGQRGVGRITSYRFGTRAELFIAIWLTGWALITAVECARQIGQSTSSGVRPTQPTEAQIYLARASVFDVSSADKTPSPRKGCNFSPGHGVLRLN
jgi:hypothetical protein